MERCSTLFSCWRVISVRFYRDIQNNGSNWYDGMSNFNITGQHHLEYMSDEKIVFLQEHIDFWKTVLCTSGFPYIATHNAFCTLVPSLAWCWGSFSKPSRLTLLVCHQTRGCQKNWLTRAQWTKVAGSLPKLTGSAYKAGAITTLILSD